MPVKKIIIPEVFDIAQKMMSKKNKNEISKVKNCLSKPVTNDVKKLDDKLSKFKFLCGGIEE